MPHRAMKPCNHPGCGVAIKARQKYCVDHLPLHRNDYKRRIPQTGIYSSTQWRVFRRMYLRRHPMCIEYGCGKMATIIDHIKPVNQGGSLYEEDNLQPMCKQCHDKKTATEDGGFGNKPGTSRGGAG